MDKSGKLAVKPAKDEFGMARTRWEYPRHRARETSEGEEKEAAKKDDDIIDCDRALMGYCFYMIKRLSYEERCTLLYRELHDQAMGVVYVDAVAREAAITALPLRYAEEEERLRNDEPKSWLQSLDGWGDEPERHW